MIWYGLKINGEIIAAILWGGRGEPTLFDFNWPLNGRDHYEIVPVTVEELR
jgi:hypothetical protein